MIKNKINLSSPPYL